MSVATSLSGCGGGGSGNSSPPPKSNYLSIVPSILSMQLNASTNLSAIMTNVDGSTTDVTSMATWATAAPGTVGVGANTGLVSGVSASSGVVVTATLNGLSATSNVIVSQISGQTSSTLFSARFDHIAAPLASGQAIVAGGYGLPINTAIGSVEIYGHSSGTGNWTETTPLITPRGDHTSVVLPDGRVLITGGADVNGNNLASSEFFDPTKLTWASACDLNVARYYNTITLLANGSVLVAGGGAITGTTATVELYNPTLPATVGCTWTQVASMSQPRNTATATLLQNGKVLVAGGFNVDINAILTTFSSAEIYDQVTNSWSPTGSLAAARTGHTATLLPSGKVLVTGGDAAGIPMNSSELYDPSTGQWTPTGNLSTARTGHTATLLPNGTVWVMGGSVDGAGTITASSELYNPGTGQWSPVTINALTTARTTFTATLLPADPSHPNGSVLAAGGLVSGFGTNSSEIYWW